MEIMFVVGGLRAAWGSVQEIPSYSNSGSQTESSLLALPMLWFAVRQTSTVS